MRKPTETKAAQACAAPAPRGTINEEWARIGATLDLANLDDYERSFLATCQKIHRRDSGCNTPFEEFFGSLVALVESGSWPTPDRVAGSLEEFRRNFDSMKREAKQFLEAYPDKEAAS